MSRCIPTATVKGEAENIYTDFEIKDMDLQDFQSSGDGPHRRSEHEPWRSIIWFSLLTEEQVPSHSKSSAVSTEVEAGGQTQAVTITWNSKEGRTYSILASDDLSEGNLDLWDELDDGFSCRCRRNNHLVH